MGDPRKQRRKFLSPPHPWEKERIKEEKQILREYGLKSKREIWKVESKLKSFANEAKRLVSATGHQAEKEKTQLLNKLRTLGLIKKTDKLDSILSLSLKDILERRLQTLILRKGLAKTVKQARQFITHRHISVGGKEITVPSYMVPLEEEKGISFTTSSKLGNQNHPERVIQKKTKKPKQVSKK
jgi:small subunit ribosomal protein S4